MRITNPFRSKRGKAVGAALIAGAGLLCYLLPERYQAPCRTCARIVGLVTGLGVP